MFSKTRRLAVGLTVAIAITGTLTATAASTTASAATEKPTATDVGVSATEIHIAVIADVDNPIVPGIFQGAVDGVRGAAKYLNSKAGGGGVAGRKLVVDFLDAKLNANAARNATITACGQDLAMVGTSVTGLASAEDMENCPDQAGAVTGIPDFSAISGAVIGCSTVSYPINPSSTVCATRDQNPQTYQSNQGVFTHLTKQHKGLHGAYVYSSDSKVGAVTGQSLIHAATGAGIPADSTTPVSALAPQSVYTPVIQQMKADGSNFQYTIGSVNGMIAARSEAQLQGLTDPKIIWMCTTACYDKALHDQAETMDGTYLPMQFLPFEESKSNPMLANFVKYVGRDKADAFAAYGWVATIAFADAVKAVVATDGVNGLTRTALFTGIKTLTKFDADGMYGTVDLADRKISACTLLEQFKNDKFVRVWPAKAGTFDCKPSNAVTYQADFAGTG